MVSLLEALFTMSGACYNNVTNGRVVKGLSCYDFKSKPAEQTLISSDNGKDATPDHQLLL